MTEAILWSNDSIHNGQNWTSAIYPTTRYEIPHVMSPIQIIFLTIYILLALIGIIGNIVVICGLCVGRHKFKKGTDILLLNLAIAGLLMSIFHVPWMLITQYFTSGVWLFGQAMCKIYNTTTLFCVLLISFTQMAICIDRYHGLSDLLKLKYRLKIWRAVGVVCIIWLSALAMCYPYLRYLDVIPSNFDNKSHCLLDLPFSDYDFYINQRYVNFIYFIYAIVYLLVAYIIPCLTMTVLYLIIIRVLRRQEFKAKILQHLYKQSRFVNNITKKEQVAKIFITCVIFFFVCNLPTSILLLLLLTQVISVEIYVKVRPFLAIIQMFGIVCNAILYGSVNTRVKKSSSSIRRKIGKTVTQNGLKFGNRFSTNKGNFKPRNFISSFSQSH